VRVRPQPAAKTTSRPEVGSFLEWPGGIARLGVVLCVAVALGYGLVYFAKALDRLGDQASSNAALNFDDREIAGGNALLADSGALYEARGLIPEEETYRVVAGPNVEGATELTQAFIDQYARYFLMPRRPSADARWILCYGCDPAELGDGFEVLWRDDNGALIGRRPA
jgi:hypothetical protein